VWRHVDFKDGGSPNVVDVTVVIEHIVLLAGARALISVSYVYLRLFFFPCLSFLSLFITYPFSLYYIIMSCMYIIIGYQLWWIFLSGSLPLLYYFKVITTLYLLLANKISDLISWWFEQPSSTTVASWRFVTLYFHFLGFQLQVTVTASAKWVSSEVAVMSDLVISMGKRFVAVCANGGRPVLR